MTSYENVPLASRSLLWAWDCVGIVLPGCVKTTPIEQGTGAEMRPAIVSGILLGIRQWKWLFVRVMQRKLIFQKDNCTMTIFYYNYQNSFRFCFVIYICQSRWGLKKNSLHLHEKTTNSRILVVVVEWRHRAIVQLTNVLHLASLWKWDFFWNRQSLNKNDQDTF